MLPISVNNLLAAIDGRVNRNVTDDIVVNRIQIDSRYVERGDLFWALEGERLDGHDFVSHAFQRGAVACVVRQEQKDPSRGLCIEVSHTLTAFWDWARCCREAFHGIVIGVTGSVGKTTTREMIHAVLETRRRGRRSLRNYNNHIGLPLSLFQLEPTDEYVVLEMGASQPGEIHNLAGLAAPHVGVVTAIAPSHLTGFRDETTIAKAKGELLDNLPRAGLAVLAGDDGAVRSLANRAPCRAVFVGQGCENDVRAKAVHVKDHCLRFTVDGWHYSVNTPARGHLTAALAAIAIGREMGIPAKEIARGLAEFTTFTGRCHVEHAGSLTIIDDTYNANPVSMAAACQTLTDWTGANKKILVVGDMLELGDASANWHRHTGTVIAQAGIDRLLAIGGEANHIVDGAMAAGFPVDQTSVCRDFDGESTVLADWMEPNDVILVKGSRGMRMERVVAWLRQHGDEKQQHNSACAATHINKPSDSVLLPA